jgi:hypothetical protein
MWKINAWAEPGGFRGAMRYVDARTVLCHFYCTVLCRLCLLYNFMSFVSIVQFYVVCVYCTTLCHLCLWYNVYVVCVSCLIFHFSCEFTAHVHLVLMMSICIYTMFNMECACLHQSMAVLYIKTMHTSDPGMYLYKHVYIRISS